MDFFKGNSEQIYYYSNNYDKPISITNEKENNIKVKSQYWDDDFGLLNNNVIYFNNLGNGTIYNDYIDFGNNNIWHKDNRRNLLYIGANTLDDISEYVNKYNNGLFIEAIPAIYEQLKYTLSKTKKYNTNYIAINLFTDQHISARKRLEQMKDGFSKRH